MATLLLAQVGQIAGSYLAGNIGGTLGYMGFAMAGRALVGPKPPGQDLEGAAAKMKESLSTNYGHPIPEVAGVATLGGHILWFGKYQVEEMSALDAKKGGKGS